MLLKCAYCLKKLFTNYVSCSECRSVNLCIKCFANGVESSIHKRTHNYTIEKPFGKPACQLFESDSSWTYEDEIKLLDALETYGYGNWNEIASMLRSHASSDCQSHYEKYYVSGLIGHHTIKSHLNSYPRIFDHSDLESDIFSRLSTCIVRSELQNALGYMPNRDEFEFEFRDSAEKLLVSMPHRYPLSDLDKEIHLALVSIYNDHIKHRYRLHYVAREHDLVNYLLRDLVKEQRGNRFKRIGRRRILSRRSVAKHPFKWPLMSLSKSKSHSPNTSLGKTSKSLEVQPTNYSSQQSLGQINPGDTSSGTKITNSVCNRLFSTSLSNEKLLNSKFISRSSDDIFTCLSENALFQITTSSSKQLGDTMKNSFLNCNFDYVNAYEKGDSNVSSDKSPHRVLSPQCNNYPPCLDNVDSGIGSSSTNSSANSVTSIGYVSPNQLPNHYSQANTDALDSRPTPIMKMKPSHPFKRLRSNSDSLCALNYLHKANEKNSCFASDLSKSIIELQQASLNLTPTCLLLHKKSLPSNSPIKRFGEKLPCSDLSLSCSKPGVQSYGSEAGSYLFCFPWLNPFLRFLTRSQANEFLDSMNREYVLRSELQQLLNYHQQGIHCMKDVHLEPVQLPSTFQESQGPESGTKFVSGRKRTHVTSTTAPKISTEGRRRGRPPKHASASNRGLQFKASLKNPKTSGMGKRLRSM